MRTQFEQHAHKAQFRKRRPSWEHNIETYTDNKNGTDRFLIGGVSVIIIVALGALVAII